ncbi:MAG: hypothetical protein EP330_28310 [Deltaproteobacteria bacterium]|nr:MAG: hypothetical protein EP330_28310 [Deltaproteobacteria bacterium]
MTGARDRALACLPIREELLAQAAFVERHAGFDEASLIVYTVEQRDGGAELMRQAWWFDEESLTWSLDASEHWSLPREGVDALVDALSPRTRQVR